MMPATLRSMGFPCVAIACQKQFRQRFAAELKLATLGMFGSRMMGKQHPASGIDPGLAQAPLEGGTDVDEGTAWGSSGTFAPAGGLHLEAVMPRKMVLTMFRKAGVWPAEYQHGSTKTSVSAAQSPLAKRAGHTDLRLLHSEQLRDQQLQSVEALRRSQTLKPRAVKHFSSVRFNTES